MALIKAFIQLTPCSHAVDEWEQSGFHHKCVKLWELKLSRNCITIGWVRKCLNGNWCYWGGKHQSKLSVRWMDDWLWQRHKIQPGINEVSKQTQTIAGNDTIPSYNFENIACIKYIQLLILSLKRDCELCEIYSYILHSAYVYCDLAICVCNFLINFKAK